MKRNLKCDETDINLEQTLINFNDNSEIETDEEFTEDDQLQTSNEMNEKKEDKKEKSFCKKIVNFIIYSIIMIIFIIGVLFLSVGLLFSYIFLLITLFMFFISFVTSYVMSPVYLALSGEWLNFAPALLQVILSSPLIAFFLFFFVNLIRKVGDLCEAIKDVFKIPFSSNQREKEDASDFSCCEFFFFLIGSVLFLGFCFLVFWLTFLCRYTCLLLGFLLLLSTLVEIIILFLPSYAFWLNILINRFRADYEKPKNCLRKFDKECFPKFLLCVRNWDDEEDSDDEKKITQATQTFVSCKGQISSKIGYSADIIDIDDFNSFTIESKESKDRCDKILDYLSKFSHVVLMREFIPIYDFAKSIVTNIHRKITIVFLWIFTILNLVLIGFDIYRAVQDPHKYFIIATVFRIAVLPLLSYYHLLTHFLVKIKDKTLRIVNHISFFFTIIIIVIIFGCFAMKSYHDKYYKVKEYIHQPINESIQYINKNLLLHPICIFSQYNVSAIEAYSYSIGVYEVINNPRIFHEEMKTFFGENYSDFIDISVENISDQIPFIIYNNTLINTVIVAFRSFNSGPEIAFILQEIAEYYVVPFFSDLIPFMETLTDFFLESVIKIAHEFGRMMFDPTNTIKNYCDTIVDICKQKGIDKMERVLFTGIGTGATLGKLASIALKKYSISFLTLPLWTDFFTSTFHLEENDMGYVTNVYTYNSFFSKPEPEFATNIGVYRTDFGSFINKYFCSADVCEINFKGETNFPTFCLIAGMCGNNAQFDHFCRTSLPYESDIDKINEFVLSIDELVE